jgi:hypothetical protein
MTYFDSKCNKNLIKLTPELGWYEFLELFSGVPLFYCVDPANSVGDSMAVLFDGDSEGFIV